MKLKQSSKFINQNKDGSVGSFVIFASLYLVLLSFFILLNTISERDYKKMRKGIVSIHKVFAAGSTKMNIISDSPKFLDFDQIINSYYKKVRKLVIEEYQLFDVSIDKIGNRIILKFPTEAFFSEEQNYVNRKKEIFLEHLMNTITANINQAKIRISIGVSSRTYLKYDPMELYKLDIQRVGELSKQLRSGGVKSDDIIAGLKADSLNQVTFEFNFYE